LMLSTQAVRGLPRLRAPGIVPCTISFSRQLLLVHPFSGLFSRTTSISCRYQKGLTSLDLYEARDGGVLGCSGISWTVLKNICTSLQRDNYVNTSSLNFYRPDALHDPQPAVSKHRMITIFNDILAQLHAAGRVDIWPFAVYYYWHYIHLTASFPTASTVLFEALNAHSLLSKLNK